MIGGRRTEGGLRRRHLFHPGGRRSPSSPLPQPKTAFFVSSTALSPDGHRLAYLACGQRGCDLDVVEVDARWQPSRPPGSCESPAARQWLAWSGDNTSVFYTTEPIPETFYLSRAWVTGVRPPERAQLAGLGARMPSMAPSQNRLAFARTLNSVGVFTLEPTARPVLRSSFWDVQPQFSPDGTKLVFTSSQSGEALHLWMAAADGSDAHQLTHGPGQSQGSPAWSPDGRRIAFDARDDDGRLTVWTMDADGGPPRQLTRGPGDQNQPTWSRDGRSIYFRLAQGATSDTWKVPAAGGAAERVTREGSASFGVESMDGRTSSTSGRARTPLSTVRPAHRRRTCASAAAVRPPGELRGHRCRDLLRRLWPRTGPVDSPLRPSGTRQGSRERSRRLAISSWIAWPCRRMARPSWFNSSPF